MFHPGSGSNRVGLIVHEGRDFPKLVKNEIEALNMHAIFVDRSYSDTTRGSNVYDVNGNRSELESCAVVRKVDTRWLTTIEFAFVIPNQKIQAAMMDNTMLESKTYHIICTPSRCIDLCLEILELRKKLQRQQPDLGARLSSRPLIVWEPMEDCCFSSERPAFLKAMEFVDVFSPNQRELLALYDVETVPDPDQDIQIVSLTCKRVLEGTKRCAIVARCGPYGCVVVRPNCRHYLAIPAYHDSLGSSKVAGASGIVVDPTGGGNAFLGGFCAALSSNSTVKNFTSYEAASFYGNVAASYAIEQFGLPRMNVSQGQEMWNSSSPLFRVAELIHRLEERTGQLHGLQTLT